MMELNYLVKENDYTTVKEILKAHFHLSERLLLKLKRHHLIFLNGQPILPHTKVHLGDLITVSITFIEKSENILPTPMNLDIIFEDDTMLIVNKPAGIPVHPSQSHFTDSLCNGIQAYFENMQISTKIRPVNRLDKDTSGIVIFAKNEYIQECLIHQMKNHTFTKYYQAILCGNLEETQKINTICAPIARKIDSIMEREIHPNGQTAITHYELIQNYIDFCLVKFQLETGRTHQIRVHCKHIGHPILGDTLYGTASKRISRQALHAYKIEFIHPITKQTMKLETVLPPDIQNLIT